MVRFGLGIGFRIRNTVIGSGTLLGIGFVIGFRDVVIGFRDRIRA